MGCSASCQPFLRCHRADQSPQILQRPPPRLRTPEPSGDALMHLFDAIGPPDHLSHLVSINSHRLTSSPSNALFYIVNLLL